MEQAKQQGEASSNSRVNAELERLAGLTTRKAALEQELVRVEQEASRDAQLEERERRKTRLEAETERFEKSAAELQKQLEKLRPEVAELQRRSNTLQRAADSGHEESRLMLGRVNADWHDALGKVKGLEARLQDLKQNIADRHDWLKRATGDTEAIGEAEKIIRKLREGK